LAMAIMVLALDLTMAIIIVDHRLVDTYKHC
jgi:hypothetical protein